MNKGLFSCLALSMRSRVIMRLFAVLLPMENPKLLPRSRFSCSILTWILRFNIPEKIFLNDCSNVMGRNLAGLPVNTSSFGSSVIVARFAASEKVENR